MDTSAISPQAAAFLLADGRLPAGGYAHSGGLEPVVDSQSLTSIDDIAVFFEGRAATVGLMAGSFAAAACRAAGADDLATLEELDAELDARTPSPTTRRVSRALGRQLRRGVAGFRPHPLLDTIREDLHQPVVYGITAAVFGLTPQVAAQIAIHESVAGPVAATAKLLGLDLYAVHAAFARLTSFLDELVAEAASHMDDPPAELPAAGAPLLDLAAEHHRSMGVRLFAS